MIRFLKQGTYILAETKEGTKILTFDLKSSYAWIVAGGIGEILVSSHSQHLNSHILTSGMYRVYQIKDEPDLTDLMHLELLVGNGVWQGYLLPTGFPKGVKKRSRIIPTHEIITKSHY